MDKTESYGPRFEVTGEVVCSDIANSRAVHRFVQKRIGKWIATEYPETARPACYFHVTFLREGQGHTIGCQVRLRLEQALWTGAHYGQTLSEALEKCLQHLIPAPAISSGPQQTTPNRLTAAGARPPLKILPTTTS